MRMISALLASALALSSSAGGKAADEQKQGAAKPAAAMPAMSLMRLDCGHAEFKDMTDFPTVYAERPFRRVMGKTLASLCGRICYTYCGALYRSFDSVFALSENGGAAKLRSYGVPEVGVVPLGVELGDFGPQRRDENLRRRLGLREDQPLLIYVGRLDGEKKPDVVVEAFRNLPHRLGAKLALIGEGPLRDEITTLGDEAIIMPRFFASHTM